MSSRTKIFHESWYQIANQRIYLRSSVRIRRQLFRGELWYVLHDPFANQFFRLRRNSYEFLARINKNKTIEQLWNELLDTNPENAPGQGEIIDLLAQLYHANLLHYDLAPDSIKLFEKFKKRRQNLIKSNILNIMFARFPLFDPYFILKFLNPLIKTLIGPAGALLWILVVGFGIKTAIDNFSTLQIQTDAILAPENLFLLYISIAFIKIFHEVGHAFTVHRYGGEVHIIGIMLMMLTPLPYTDATASWAFRRKWQRILVSSAGMIFELFVAAIAVMIWAGTGAGLVHTLAYNIIFTASVSTLLFNINPLLRYDGYYILSDLVGIPNLQKQSTQQITWFVERYAFGKKDETPVASNTKEAWLLSIYAILSIIYKFFVFTGIMLFVANKMLLIAIIMAISFLFSWAFIPLFNFIKYLTSNPGLSRVRGRAIRVSIIAAGTIFLLTWYIPFPYSFKAPGVLKAVGYFKIVNPAEGRVIRIDKKSGSTVKQGDTLFLLENPVLINQSIETKAALLQAEIGFDKALVSSHADMEPMSKKIQVYSQRLEYLRKKIKALAVEAPIDGIWVAPDVDDFVGRTMPRGTPAGELIDPEQFYFASVISQNEISELFALQVKSAAIRLSGEAGKKLLVKNYTIIPVAQTNLPSSALGFSGGGDVAVNPADSSGQRTLEPFYEVRAFVEQNNAVQLLNGRSGRIRFSLGNKPILWQAWRKVRQLVQKHYQV
ncbi:MAG: hypothetical protein JW915_23520 [Chitinispirillaceae bacterium]|nr:hypothetical protein [Chitinispirillaceae bacterium]